MLFNSFQFLYLFLPFALLAMVFTRRLRPSLGTAVMTVLSLIFYATWALNQLWLLIASVCLNFLAGKVLSSSTRHRGSVLGAAVSGNLAVLGLFKYAGFAVHSLDRFFGLSIPSPHWALPLGISFYTFTQITFLVDVYRGIAQAKNPVNYGLFVTFFPHLVAGPILHHGEMIPQFERPEAFRFRSLPFARGLTLFALGMAKKALIADTLAPTVNQSFDALSRPEGLGFLAAWTAALGYTFQLYFDFSGYCDMALGLSELFGIRLPVNFNSPYKAASIIDFWRRWHMTLSALLRDYLYFPLGGNRKGAARRWINLGITMILGGLWHGAQWTFVAWGAFHGLLLGINHAWRTLTGGGKTPARLTVSLPRPIAIAFTFGATTAGWVLFRAPSLTAARRMLGSMTGFGGETPAPFSTQGHFLPALAIAALIAWCLPNTAEIFGLLEQPCEPKFMFWRPSHAWAGAGAALLVGSILLLNRSSQFLYFNF